MIRNVAMTVVFVLFVMVVVAVNNNWHSNIKVVSDNGVSSDTSNSLTTGQMHGQLDDAVIDTPNSLKGTDIEFPLLVDEEGNLVINDGLVELFEWHLSSLGELTLDQIKSRINLALTNRLRGKSLEQAQHFFERYIGYKEELANLQSYINEQHDALSQSEQIQLKKQKLQSLRAQYFAGYEYESLFQASDDYDQFLLQHLAITNDPSLSPEEKQDLIKENEMTLPLSIQESRHNAIKYSDAQVEVANLKGKGATDAEIYEYRKDTLGEEAAQSLAELDVIRLEWQSRVDTFSLEKLKIQESGLSDQDKQQQIDNFLSNNFTDVEAKRVRAITGTY